MYVCVQAKFEWHPYCIAQDNLKHTHTHSNFAHLWAVNTHQPAQHALAYSQTIIDAALQAGVDSVLGALLKGTSPLDDDGHLSCQQTDATDVLNTKFLWSKKKRTTMVYGKTHILKQKFFLHFVVCRESTSQTARLDKHSMQRNRQQCISTIL